MSSQQTGLGAPNDSEFGANEWLVDELYEQFRVDKNSVDKEWWPILEAYQPLKGEVSSGEVGAADAAAPAPAPAAVNEPAPVTAPIPPAGTSQSPVPLPITW